MNRDNARLLDTAPFQAIVEPAQGIGRTLGQKGILRLKCCLQTDKYSKMRCRAQTAVSAVQSGL